MHTEIYGETHIGSVDGWRPPECESTVGDLIQTRSLCISQLLVFHRLFKTWGFLPEQTLPCREVCSLEECVLQYALHTTESLDHVCTIVVQIPQLTIVSLVSPPERILF